MFTQTGSCPKCGAPIYAPTIWMAVIPPPPQYTCACAAAASPYRIVTTNTTAVAR